MGPRRLGEYLINAKSCRNGQIDQALQEQSIYIQKGRYRPLGRILVEGGHLMDGDLGHALKEQRMDVLNTVSVFKNLSKEFLLHIVEVTEQDTFPEKTIIFQQGEPGDTFCVVISGRLRVYRTSQAGFETTLAILGPGEGLGEMALMTGQARSASVETLEPTSLVVLSKQTFFTLCKENLDFALGCIRFICERLDQDNLHVEEVSEKELAIKRLFGKYITPQIRDEILSNRIPLDGEIKEVTILFADLKGFTPLVESTPPKEVVKMLNRYFGEMSEAISCNKGLVLQYIGDEIEAVFGAPLPLPDHPTLAVKAALEMRNRLEAVNRDLRRQGQMPLMHSIGIHTGEVVAANIGSPDRMSYTLIGDTVNTASRLQGIGKNLGKDIIVSKSSRERIVKEFCFQQLPPTPIKGKSGKMEIFALN